MRVLVAENISVYGIDKLREAGLNVDDRAGISRDELLRDIKEYDALIVRSQVQVDKDMLAAASKLKVVGRAGVGVDNIDVEAATRKGVVVLNSPEGNTIATAEHTFAMMMALSRKIPQAYMLLKSGKWERKSFVGVELYKKTLGIVGLGRIGTEVGKRALAFGMKVLAFDPFSSPDKARKLGIELVDLETLFKTSDFITVHTPLTKDTLHIIGDEEFSMMKDGVRIINCARGGIIDEAALYKWIKQGKVAGAALDVYEEEPPFGNPLLELDNVITAPHLGASTLEAQINVAVDIAEQVIRALKGEPFSNAVNLPFLKPEVLAAAKPYLKIAETLGSFQSQLNSGFIREVELIYSGELAHIDVSGLTAAFIKGFLSHILGEEEVNLVNAFVLAKSRGIDITQTKSGSPIDFNNLITTIVKSDKGQRIVEGTLLCKDEARIVQLDGHRIDAVPEGHFLIIPHSDRPGIIGQVGTILGKANVNIAAMQVGRESIGGRAVMLLGIDNQAAQKVVDELSRIEGIHDIEQVWL